MENQQIDNGLVQSINDVFKPFKTCSNQTEFIISNDPVDIISCNIQTETIQPIKIDISIIYSTLFDCNLDFKLFRIDENNEIVTIYTNIYSIYMSTNNHLVISINDNPINGNNSYIIEVACDFNLTIINTSINFFNIDQKSDIDNLKYLPSRSYFSKQSVQERENTDRSLTMVQNEMWSGYEALVNGDAVITVTTTEMHLLDCDVHETVGMSTTYPLRILLGLEVGIASTTLVLTMEIHKIISGIDTLITSQTQTISNPNAGPWVNIITYDNYVLNSTVHYYVILKTDVGQCTFGHPVLAIDDIGGVLGPTSKYCLEVGSNWPIYDHYWWWMTWCTYEAGIARTGVRIAFKAILENTLSVSKDIEVRFGFSIFETVSWKFETYTLFPTCGSFTAEAGCNKIIYFSAIVDVPQDYYLVYALSKVTSAGLFDTPGINIKESSIGFDVTRVSISISNSNGQLSVNGTSVTFSNPYDHFAYDPDSLTIEVTPNNGYKFGSWTGADASRCQLLGSGDYSIVAQEEFTILIANFVVDAPTNYNLTIVYVGSYGTTNPAGSVAPGTVISCTANQNKSVTITPNANCTAAWSGAATGSSTSAQTIQIMMDGVKTLTVTFTQNAATTYTLTVVSSNSSLGIIDTSYTTPDGSYAYTHRIELKATPIGNNVFVRWDMPGVTLSDYTLNPHSFFMPQNDINITAHFSAGVAPPSPYPKICSNSGPVIVYSVAESGFDGHILDCTVVAPEDDEIVIDFEFTINNCIDCTCDIKVFKNTVATPIYNQPLTINESDVGKTIQLSVNDDITIGTNVYHLYAKRQ